MFNKTFSSKPKHLYQCLVVLVALIPNVLIHSQCNKQQISSCGELIMNNSFEYTDFPFTSTPPNNEHCLGELNWQCHWNNGDLDFYQEGTPDIFNVDYSPSSACSGISCDIPNNFAGTQVLNTPPPFGNPQNSYAGIYTLITRTTPMAPEYREYIIQHLDVPVAPGETLTVSMMASLAEISSRNTTISVGFLGGYTSPGLLGHTAYTMNIDNAYKLTMTTTSGTSGWQPLGGIWVNNTMTTITDVIIGNFDSDNYTTSTYCPAQLTHSSWANLPEENIPTITDISYYYIDDISIQHSDPCCSSADVKFINSYNGTFDPDGDDILMSSIYGALSAATNIYVMGELIIDGNGYDLINKNVTFGPDSRVTIKPGFTWNISTSHLHGCKEMWDGIYLDALPCTLNVSGSTIEDAKIAVSVKNNSTVSAYNNQFINNLVSIRYDDHTMTTSNLIRRNTFQSTLTNSMPAGLPNLGYLLPPHNGKRSTSGIEMYNSTISLNTIVATDKNFFQYMKNGVISINSNLLINNSKFLQIKNYESATPVIDYGIAIFSMNTTSSIKYLTVGDPSLPLEINQCDNGISARERLQTNIINNTIQNITWRAVGHRNIPTNGGSSTQINIANNIIKSSYEGIINVDCGHTKTNIANNMVVNLSEISGCRGIVIHQSSTVGTGLCSNVATSLPIQITDNTVTRFVIGINTYKATCMNIYRNNVNLVSPSTLQHHGVWMDYSPYNVVTHNTITGNFKDWQCTGLRMYNSTGVQVGCNTIDNNGIAIWLDNDCSGSKFASNTLNRYNRGFLFVGSGKVGPQTTVGATNYSLKNNFDKGANSLYDFVADPSIVGTNSIFYFKPEVWAPLYDIDFLEGAVVDYSWVVTSSSMTGISNSYGGFTSPTRDKLDLRDGVSSYLALGYNGCGIAAITGSDEVNWNNMILHDFKTEYYDRVQFASGDQYAESHKWMYNYNTYRTYNLVKDQTDFETVPSIIKEISKSDVVLFDRVENLIASKDWNGARELNNSIQAETDYSRMLQHVNTLLIEEWNKIDGETYYDLKDESVKKEILRIANLCVNEYGDAVLKSRTFIHNYIDPSMEFVDPCQVIVYNDQVNLSGTENTEEKETYAIYPNPSNKIVNIDHLGNGNVSYRVTDMLGKDIINGSFEGSFTMNVENWKDGIYIIYLSNQQGEKTFRVAVTK